MRKVSIVIVGVFAMMVFTGCGNKLIDNNVHDMEIDFKGKCKPVECMNQISVNHTFEEVNQIIGFSGELTDDKYNIYYWKLSDDVGIEISYYSGKTGTVKLDIDHKFLKNNNVDFSKYEELQSKVKEGIDYDSFKNYIGNVDGIITEKNSVTTKYTWVDNNENYLTASFSNRNQNCTFVSGRIKSQ